MNEVYKPLGLLSITITWLTLAFLLVKWSPQKGKSISQHAAASKQAYFMMGIVETIVLPLFYLFIVKWFVPHFQLPRLFTVTVSLSALGFFIAAWIPDTQGWLSIVHRLWAYGSATLFIPATTILCLSSNISDTAKITSFIVLAYEIISLSLFFTTEKAKQFHLYLQGGYILLFHVLILTTVYTH
jgi:hypothetical protein